MNRKTGSLDAAVQAAKARMALTQARNPEGIARAYATEMRLLYGHTGDQRYLRAAKILQPMPRQTGRPSYDDAAYLWRIHVLVETQSMKVWPATSMVVRHVPLKGATESSVRKRLAERYKANRHTMPDVEAQMRELTAILDVAVARTNALSTGLSAYLVPSG